MEALQLMIWCYGKLQLDMVMYPAETEQHKQTEEKYRGQRMSITLT